MRGFVILMVRQIIPARGQAILMVGHDILASEDVILTHGKGILAGGYWMLLAGFRPKPSICWHFLQKR